MPDVFISYSSKDRAVAERVRDALAEAGYDIFWDQEIPAGTDWDSWIRERLTGSRLAIVLWSKVSVASPNVRHEAIIARDAGGLLPLMVDDLAPTDFPMGLFLVQAMKIGRTQREFNAARAKLLEEVRARIGEPGSGSDTPPTRTPKGPSKRRKRLVIGAGIAAVALAALLVFFWPTISFMIDPDKPPVAAEQLRASIAREGPARERVARSAETALSGDREAIGTSWAWFAGQLVSAAPEESRSFAESYFRYLASVERPDCGCFIMEGIPNSIGNGWVITTYAQYRRPAPPRLLETILAAQHAEGWWTISLNGVKQPANAAVHATAMLAIALSEARRAGIVPSPFRPRVDAAIRRATSWLNRGPETGANWADNPSDERRSEHLVFAAMATVATEVAGGAPNGHAARAFIASAEALPPPIEHFPSGIYVELENGERYIDNYRHPVSPWIGAAAVLAYRNATAAERAKLRPIIRSWIDVDLSDENLLRQDWITGETLFLRALAFRHYSPDRPATR